jgi:hypothetical protein
MMKEEFLHYVWKYKKFAFAKAQTTTSNAISLISVGMHNQLAGPDFFNAQLYIEDQLWEGNVEIHLKSSDWYAHGHEADPAYDSVILHVVWEHDIDIFRLDNSAIPTLELKKFVTKDTLSNYKTLFSRQQEKWINCETHLQEVPKSILDHWLERLYIERLEYKTQSIQSLLLQTHYDWEAVLFCMLARNFGTKINGLAFHSLAETIDFGIVRKCARIPFQLEALFFGMGGLLSNNSTDSYVLQLHGEYEYLKNKFSLENEGVLPIHFFKLRPDNFPTIRLAQLAQLYHKHSDLFQKLMNAKTLKTSYKIFEVAASPYWDTHYSFSTPQKKREKRLTKSFMDLLLINTVIPLKFAYNQHQGKAEQEEILSLISEIKPENNVIIKKYNSLGLLAKNAQETQALLSLKTQYCEPNKCLSCGIGNWLIGK